MSLPIKQGGLPMEKSRFIQFSSLVGSVTKSIQSMKMEKMAHYGLSAAHTNLLCHLAESGEEGMTQGELAQAELMDKAQVSRVLQNLEEKGYVRQNPGKGLYKRRYTMTAEGRAVTDEMEAILLAMNRFVSRDIPDADLVVFYRTFGIIAQNLSRLEVSVAERKEDTLYE